MRLIILGAGGYGRTVYDLAHQSGRYDSIAFLDDNADGPAIFGKCSDYLSFVDGQTEMYPAFGNNTGRLIWLDKLAAAGISVPTMIHPTAYVSPMAIIGPGCVILPKAVVNTGTMVERGCIVNCGAIVDHDCVLGEGVHVCLGAIVKAENKIPSCMKVEAGEVIENRTYLL